MTANAGRRWRVAELADATGVAARTLHFYDEIGLLVPSRPSAGPRLYSAADVTRLYRIVVLRRLGHPVRRIASLLGDDGIGLPETVRRHRDELQAGDEAALREIEALLEHSIEPEADRLIATLAAMADPPGAGQHAPTGPASDTLRP